MAGRKAPGGRDKLAVILSGNAARATALLGALETLEAAGLQPAVIVGVSGGAVAGALYAACGKVAEARDALYACAEQASWQDLADLDCAAVLNLLARPNEVPGVIRGNALQDGLLAGPIGHLGFQHLDCDLFVLACDLNSGREMVFGKQTAEARPDAPYQLFAKSEADLDRVNVATACRASCLVPGLCRPLDLDHYCLVDGSLRLRRALTVAAAQKGVKRILWLHAGLDENDAFSLVTDYSGQSFASGWCHAMTVLGADQFDPHTGDPLLDGVAVRALNLATASIGAHDLSRTQQVYESGRRSLAAILAKEPCAGGNGLFTADREAVVAALATDADESGEARWGVTIGQGGRDVLAIVDRMPAIQQEFGYEFDEYLAGAGLTKITPAEPTASAEWALAGAEKQLGLGRLAWFGFSRFAGYTGKALRGGLAVACQALTLDRQWRRLTELTARTTVSLSDTLRRGKTGS